MSFVDPAEIEELKNKLTSDLSQLGRLHKAKRNQYYLKSVDHNLVDDMLTEGWEEYTDPLKTKTKLRKIKDFDVQFEDDIWCQLYDLGYRHLNFSNDFRLPFGKDPKDRKQIDVVAINDESVLLIECKSAEMRGKRAPSFKSEFEGLPIRLDGFSKAIEQMLGKGRKVKYIFATRNLRLDETSADIVRLRSTGSYFYRDKTYEYVNSLIKNYKEVAFYQFSALLFRGQSINKNKIELPAIEGKMGGRKYYMFSIEPSLLLKMGFVLHRTSANESEMPTYQRLLVPNRLKGIRSFINGGGSFPNSVILNFSKNGKNLQFEADARGKDTDSRCGTLKIPNTYAIAYIIDGQHRIYGYTGTDYLDNNTIPVVAFEGLGSIEQLEMFMNINQNQKAVSPTLRITLEEDLYWDADRADSRIKALRSSIIQKLSGSINGPLYNKISIGEDKHMLTAKPFSDAFSQSNLLPTVKGNKFNEELSKYSLYDTHNLDHRKAMMTSRDNVVKFINLCYEFVEVNYSDIYEQHQSFVLSNRGTYAFICLVSSLNDYETDRGDVSHKTLPEERFASIEKYLNALMKELRNLPKEYQEYLRVKLGQSSGKVWFKHFQMMVNKNFPTYEPLDLVDWKERQDKELQNKGREIGVNIEKHIKNTVIGRLKELFGENWDIEIGAIQRDCEKRAKEEMEKRYRETNERVEILWTDQFFITDYKKIIEKYWTKESSDADEGDKSFEQLFSIDVGFGFNSKSEKIKWLSLFNSHRNSWAHEGTKEKGLNKEEVDFLRKVHDELLSK